MVYNVKNQCLIRYFCAYIVCYPNLLTCYKNSNKAHELISYFKWTDLHHRKHKSEWLL